jgi:hypothetical protein
MKSFLLGTAARFYLAVNLKSVADLEGVLRLIGPSMSSQSSKAEFA